MCLSLGSGLNAQDASSKLQDLSACLPVCEEGRPGGVISEAIRSMLLSGAVATCKLWCWTENFIFAFYVEGFGCLRVVAWLELRF